MTGLDRYAAFEDELVALYAAALKAVAARAVSRFRARAPVRAVTAASQPDWTPPTADELVTAAALADVADRAGKVRARILAAVAADMRASFSLANPLAATLIDRVSERSAGILGGFQDAIASTLAQAHTDGLSVPKTAAALRARLVDATQVQATLAARSDLVSIVNGGSLLAAQIVDQESAAAGEEGVGGKTWVTAGDEKVRDSHAEADGQTVPLDQPFEVGGESLMYPGDPDGSLEETLNCRCVITYGGALAAGGAPTAAVQSSGTMDAAPEDTIPALVLRDFHLTAAAGEPTRWQATLLVEDEPTEDGRMIAAGAAQWRALPLPLGLMTDTGHADEAGAPVCGRIDQIWRAGQLVQAAGVFDTSTVGLEAERLVRERMITGISCDGVCTASEVIVTQTADDSDADQELIDEVDQVVGGDPEIAESPVAEEDLEYMFVATEYMIMGATICPAGAIAQARIDVIAASGDKVGEGWRILAAFEPSVSEVSTAADVAPMEAEDAGAMMGAFIAAAARRAANDVSGALRDELVSPLTAAQTDRAAFAAEIAAIAEALPKLAAVVKEIGPALLTVKRELGDRLASLEGQQTATLTASGATAEGLDDLGRRLDALDTIAGDLERLRELLERKPRNVEVKRDNRGRMVGFTEG